MRIWLVVCVWLAIGFYGLAGSLFEHRLRVAHYRGEHRYIYGFGIRHGRRDFWEYVPPVAAEGLREIRWNHMPRPLAASALTYEVVTVGSLPVATTSTTGIMTCLQPAYSSIVVAR